MPPKAALEFLEGRYSSRRILPTLAHKSGFDITEQLDGGGWTDAKDTARGAMPDLCSSAKLHMANQRIAELVVMTESIHTIHYGRI